MTNMATKGKTFENRSMEINNARLAAVRILTRIEKEGAYANLLLRTQLHFIKDKRDSHLTTALVNGVLKNKLLLDFALRRHLSKPMSALPYEVRSVLRTGVFQILFLEKIPVPVAINESVETAAKLNPSFVPLVNGVLRKVAETGWDLQLPDINRQTLRYLSIRYSHPEWLVKRWLSRWGAEETERLLQADNSPSPTCIRANTLKTTPELLFKELELEGIKVESGTRAPEALYIEDFGAVEKLRFFREGLLTVQDESSQLVAHILRVRPGQRVLDVCCAPGGKTTHMAQLMKNNGEIIALDINPRKLFAVGESAKRLGITIIRTMEGDAGRLDGVEGKFDRVLVDAPCSGLGVIRRRADLRWRKRQEEIAELPPLQLKILLRAADFVFPGGELVYSTCTTEPEENFEIVKAFRRLRPEFKSVDLSQTFPFTGTEPRDLRQLQTGTWQILPHLHNMDGFFMAKFKLEGL